MVDIVETQPTEIIEILNADINVDFDIALDYDEAENTAGNPVEANESKSQGRDVSSSVANYKLTYDMERFPGKGNRLGSN